ncbi:DUF2490 domain-containing protein [Panacibacter ginsenosidivorans]|uniref:DUF2490 domain-containing protein n=1 Tax=Panacibacter ginsenosidivorans TaxID=1813871 RepID=A0A5B8VBH1_9BACT|nr:DUF2490 domain-containing protein [Panacibacter ginsenosidivorans]QEC68692.1 DUF2490 domain-containing protein [Panacibacter ginsenosidivorans]
MRKTLAAILFLSPLFSLAQNRINEYNTIGWYAFFITPKISNKVSAHIEYQWRRTGIIKNWQQSLPRVGINYKINSNLTVQAGYAFIHTFPYGTTTLAAVPKTFPEHRIYEQLTVTTPVGKTNLTHRLRLEQRWPGRFNSIESEKPDTWIYLNRVRYMPRLDVPFNKKWYAAAYDEIFIGFGKNVGENIFDQNRIALMAGFKFNPTIRIEAGYINQIVQLGREVDNKNVFQQNNGIVLNTYININ